MTRERLGDFYMRFFPLLLQNWDSTSLSISPSEEDEDETVREGHSRCIPLGFFGSQSKDLFCTTLFHPSPFPRLQTNPRLIRKSLHHELKPDKRRPVGERTPDQRRSQPVREPFQTLLGPDLAERGEGGCVDWLGAGGGGEVVRLQFRLDYWMVCADKKRGGKRQSNSLRRKADFLVERKNQRRTVYRVDAGREYDVQPGQWTDG